MYNLDMRIRRIADELAGCIHPAVYPVEGMEIRRGQLPKGANPEALTDGWQPYERGSAWAMPDTGEYALFRAKAAIPDGFGGKTAALLCRTNKNGWNALNPQFLLYVDGEVRQAYDTNHGMAILSRDVKAGQSFSVALSAFGGLHAPHSPDAEPVKLFLDLAVLDGEVWGLYFDLTVPLKLSERLPRDSAEWHMIVEALNDACNILDLRAPGSGEFRESVLRARDSLKKGLYANPKNVLPATAYCVGQTHIDVAWQWQYSHTREKTVRSFSTALTLMEEYPGFGFMSSQPQLFAFLKEDYPDVYERVRRQASEGRFEVEGGMWVESDTNVPSGESLVRQFLHGKRFMQEEFGADSKILWLPDVFGYSASLPQIMKKSGVDYFMTSKLKNNELNRMPHNTFLWKGIDGTEILTQLTSYNPNFYNGQAQNCEMLECWREYLDKHLNSEILYTYGYGDGGGGPTREMAETVQRFEKGLPGAPIARFSSVSEYFKQLDKNVRGSKRLAAWQGELYYEYHRGTYTSMAKNKRSNRKSEFLLTNAEWAASMNSVLLGGAYPADTLDACWKTVLLNQFHDVLPGSSIKAVYDDTDVLYARLTEQGGEVLNGAMESLAANIDAPAGSIIAFNPLSWTRESAVYFDAQDGEWALSDGTDTFPAQRCGDGRYVAFVRGIPSKGWLALSIVPGKRTPVVKAGDTFLENDCVRIKIGKDGAFTSIYDKKAGRETLKKGEAGNKIIACEDKPFREDNWNLDNYYMEKTWDIPARSVKLIEQGPVRAVVRTERSFMTSTITQDIVLWRGSPRVDIVNSIDWKERDICLKAQFPVDVNASQATYEIQYGHLTRPTHSNTSWDEARYEVCAHKWADISDGGFGMSLINDSKYGHDALNGCLRLTLLRCGCYPNPDADKERHSFTYSVLPHSGGWMQAGTVRQAYDLNVPVLAIKGGGGTLPASYSFARPSEENVVLEVIKRAEDGDGIILRLYDAWNRSGKCGVTMGRDILSAEECDLMERKTGSADFSGNTLSFAYKPFEIKTFRVRM